MKKIEIEIEYRGLECRGHVVFGDWEGDRSVPGGVHELPPYVEDLQVEANGEDLYDLLTEGARDEIIAAIIECAIEDAN